MPKLLASFQKFSRHVDRHLGPMMKSVGEVMSIARSFEEALQKAIRGLDIGKVGLVGNPNDGPESLEQLRDALRNPTDGRIFRIAKAIKQGIDINEISDLSGIDKWFLYKIRNIVELERELEPLSLKTNETTLVEYFKRAKKLGFSDRQLARYLRTDEMMVREFRKQHDIVPSFKIVDTMAAEWESQTNYCYATYGDTEDDVDFVKGKNKIIVIGAGCIRIGSSVEFDYCTMNTAWAIKDEGFDEVIVINNNPETVSTDYDMSDKLYFEEISLERVLDIVDREDPFGVVVSVGGQTPNNLALPLSANGVRLIGTSASGIDRAEDRSKFSALLDRLSIPQPIWSSLTSTEELKEFSEKVGYPVLVRPSYVLSGEAIRVAKDELELLDYVKLATEISPNHPIVVSKFIVNAKEVEVDAVSDGRDTLIGAIIEHIELAGTHSGDASMIIPPQTLSRNVISKIRDYTYRIARALNIRGPFNIQFLVKDEAVYIIECNLRASRSMPYSSKATGIPLIWIGAKVMLGKMLNDVKRPKMMHVAVKVPTFSFMRLKGADPVLGVEMTSTGEVACIDYSFSGAFIKALIASNLEIPRPGTPILITCRKEDQEYVGEIATKMSRMGYPILTTRGTVEALEKAGLEDFEVLDHIPDTKDLMTHLPDKNIGLVINTMFPDSKDTWNEGYAVRRAAVEFLIPVITRIETARALVDALEQNNYGSILGVLCLEDLLRSSSLAKYL